MTLPEDVEIGATSSPAVGVIGATSDVFEVAAIGELVAEEDKWRKLGVLDVFLTESNMFGQKLLISLEYKWGEEFTPNPRVMTDIEIFPTDETLTHRTPFTPMIKDVFHLIPRTSV